MWAGWFYILEAGAGEVVLFLDGDSLVEARRYQDAASVTYVKA